MGRFDYYNASYRGSYENLHHEHHQRTYTIYKSITWNRRRKFAGTVLPNTSGKGLDELHGFRRDGVVAPGSMAVYCTDGANRN
jgi:hypothetical protein